MSTLVIPVVCLVITVIATGISLVVFIRNREDY